MSITGIRTKEENPFYAPYDDDCWVVLAKTIMKSYADRYAYQFPTTALSQSEYATLDRKTYLPIRHSILRNVMNGPLKHVADMPSIHRAFEERRQAQKAIYGITWKEDEYDRF